MATSPRMLRIVFLSSGTALFVAGCLLLLFSFVGQGINDAEWGTISQTGLPSHPGLFTWSAWRPNDGSVQPFPTFQTLQHPDAFPEFRVGRGKSLWFDFVFYQGRFTRDGVTQEFPAIGPGSGAVYHWGWAWMAFAGGTACLFIWRYALPETVRSNASDSSQATSVP